MPETKLGTLYYEVEYRVKGDQALRDKANVERQLPPSGGGYGGASRGTNPSMAGGAMPPLAPFGGSGGGGANPSQSGTGLLRSQMSLERAEARLGGGRAGVIDVLRSQVGAIAESHPGSSLENQTRAMLARELYSSRGEIQRAYASREGRIALPPSIAGGLAGHLIPSARVTGTAAATHPIFGMRGGMTHGGMYSSQIGPLPAPGFIEQTPYAQFGGTAGHMVPGGALPRTSGPGHMIPGVGAFGGAQGSFYNGALATTAAMGPGHLVPNQTVGNAMRSQLNAPPSLSFGERMRAAGQTNIMGSGMFMNLLFGGWEVSSSINAAGAAGRFAKSNPSDLTGQLAAWNKSLDKMTSGPMGSMVGMFAQGARGDIDMTGADAARATEAMSVREAATGMRRDLASDAKIAAARTTLEKSILAAAKAYDGNADAIKKTYDKEVEAIGGRYSAAQVRIESEFTKRYEAFTDPEMSIAGRDAVFRREDARRQGELTTAGVENSAALKRATGARDSALRNAAMVANRNVPLPGALHDPSIQAGYRASYDAMLKVANDMPGQRAQEAMYSAAAQRGYMTPADARAAIGGGGGPLVFQGDALRAANARINFTESQRLRADTLEGRSLVSEGLGLRSQLSAMGAASVIDPVTGERRNPDRSGILGRGLAAQMRRDFDIDFDSQETDEGRANASGRFANRKDTLQLQQMELQDAIASRQQDMLRFGGAVSTSSPFGVNFAGGTTKTPDPQLEQIKDKLDEIKTALQGL